MALAAPGRFDGPWPEGSRRGEREATASARSDVGSPRDLRFTDIVDLDSKNGSPRWGRPGFVFSARVGERRSDGFLLLETNFARLGVRGGEGLSGLIRLRVEGEGATLSLRLLSRGTELGRISERSARAVPDATLLRALGLPVDDLSGSLLAFARAFGLNLDPPVLRSLRRTSLRAGADREAAALAATAAEAKGVRLTDEALGEYVEAIDVNAGRDRSDEDGERQGQNPDGRGQNSGGEGRKRPEPPTAEDLRVQFEAVSASGDALSYLNALPGADGTRWIVFPVRLGPEGVEFRAVVRILLIATQGREVGRVGRWAVDVAARGRTWSFAVDCLCPPPLSLWVSAEPPLGTEAPRVRAALTRAFDPFGFVVQVSAQRDERRFPDRRAEAPAVFDAEA